MNNPIPVLIREPKHEDENAFIAAMQLSQSLHYPWINAPQTSQEVKSYIQRLQKENQKSFLVCDKKDNIAGVNISKIARGLFQNAYFGFLYSG